MGSSGINEGTMVRISGCNHQTLGAGVLKIQCNNPHEVLVRNCLSTQKSLKCPEDSHMASFAVNLNWTRSGGMLLILFWIVLLVVMIANFHRTLNQLDKLQLYFMKNVY